MSEGVTFAVVIVLGIFFAAVIGYRYWPDEMSAKDGDNIGVWIATILAWPAIVGGFLIYVTVKIFVAAAKFAARPRLLRSRSAKEEPKKFKVVEPGRWRAP